MKVFFVFQTAFPGPGADTKRVICYAKGLAAQGVESEVLTISWKGDESEANGVEYKMMGHPHKNSQWSKISTYFYNLFCLLSYLKKHTAKSDIIYIYHNDLITGFVSKLFSRSRIIVRELCEIPYYNNIWKNRFKRWGELHFLFKHYKGIVAISDPLVQLANQYKGQNCKILKIPILVDFEPYENVIPVVQERPFLFHSGTRTEEKDGFLGILESIGLLKEKYGIELDLFCTGIEQNNSNIQDILDKYKVASQIKYLGFLNNLELIRWQKGAVLCVVNKNDTLQNQFCFATKIGEYLASGLLLITTTVGEAKRYFVHNESAVLIESGVPMLLADEIHRMMEDETLRKTIACNGVNIAREYFDYLNNGIVLADFFSNLNS